MKTVFARFAFVGFLGVAMQLGLLRLLPKHATLAVELTILHNFLWHEHFTWRGPKTRTVFCRLWRFHLANGVVSLFGNTVLTHTLVTHVHLPAVPAALASIAVCSLANFTLARLFLWGGAMRGHAAEDRTLSA